MEKVKAEKDSSIPSAEMKPTPELKAAPPFTPGPWYISETSSNKKGVFSEAQPVAIAEIIGFPLRRQKNSDANARLIAAAPALYEAGRKVLASMNLHIDAASAMGRYVPLFDGIAELYDALALVDAQTSRDDRGITT